MGGLYSEENGIFEETKMITVKELIEVLKEYDQNLEVYVENEGELCEIWAGNIDIVKPYNNDKKVLMLFGAFGYRRL